MDKLNSNGISLINCKNHYFHELCVVEYWKNNFINNNQSIYVCPFCKFNYDIYVIGLILYFNMFI